MDRLLLQLARTFLAAQQPHRPLKVNQKPAEV